MIRTLYASGKPRPKPSYPYITFCSDVDEHVIKGEYCVICGQQASDLYHKDYLMSMDYKLAIAMRSRMLQPL